jgi:ribosomal protein S18 acetylase RimI-like enzyme
MASLWVAVDEQGLAGNLGLEPVEIGRELRRMHVDARCCRNGLGRLMLARAERAVRQQGSARIGLSRRELQQPAILLYRAAGYQLVREEVATTATNRTVGSGLRRFYFERSLTSAADWTRS